jgi:hypothetical protein
MIEKTAPRGATTTPATPFTSAGRTNGERPANVIARAATSRAPRTSIEAIRRAREGDLEALVAVLDPDVASGAVGAGCTRRRATRELPRRRRRAIDDRRDLVERDPEHVVPHEGEPLGRRQRLEHHEQGQTDRVGEERLVLGLHA